MNLHHFISKQAVPPRMFCVCNADNIEPMADAPQSSEYVTVVAKCERYLAVSAPRVRIRCNLRCSTSVYLSSRYESFTFHNLHLSFLKNIWSTASSSVETLQNEIFVCRVLCLHEAPLLFDENSLKEVSCAKPL
jgi:hypothetical protein